MSSNRHSSSPSIGGSSKLPLPAGVSSKGGSTAVVSRSASTSTLPSIRSLRKAFQFTSNNNNKKSGDYYNGIGRSSSASSGAGSNNILRKSTSSATNAIVNGGVVAHQPGSRSSIGYNPLAHLRNSHQQFNGSSNSVITKSSSTNDISNRLSEPSSYSGSGVDGKNVKNEVGYNDDDSAEKQNRNTVQQPLASPPLRTAIYNSSIPVNSRPISTFSTPKSTPSIKLHDDSGITVNDNFASNINNSSRGSPKSIGDITKISEQIGRDNGTPTSTIDSLSSQEQEKEEQTSFDRAGDREDNDGMPVMHITRTSPKTPPPSLPLPAVPQSSSSLQNVTSSSNEGKRDSIRIQTMPSTSSDTVWPSMQVAESSHKQDLRSSSIDGFIPTTAASTQTLLMHETAPDTLNSIGDISLASPARPTITRSRSAIESIRAMAAEADLLSVDDTMGTTSITTAGGNLTNNRTRQSSLPKPIIMESPSRSPALMELGSIFHFPPSSSAGSGIASVAEFGDNNHNKAIASSSLDQNDFAKVEESSSRNREDSFDSGKSLSNSASGGSTGETQAYVRRLRHSSTSPLTELVVRLASQANSPNAGGNDNPDLIEFSRSTSSLAHEMDTSDLRSEEDAMSEMQDGSRRSGGGDSPFISQGMLEDQAANTSSSIDDQEDLSVTASSGIIVPTITGEFRSEGSESIRSPEVQKRSFEELGGRRLVQDRLSQMSSEDGNKVQLRDPSGNKISPQTEKRWSMAEVEAAYGRIRQLANRRTSAAISETPSLIISEDSKDYEGSYIRQILEKGYPLDASMTSSASHGTPRPSSVGADPISSPVLPRTNSTAIDSVSSLDEQQEGEDALTPLVGVERYSPVASPRLSPRSLSPHTFQHSQAHSVSNHLGRRSLDSHRTESPYSSGTASTGHGKSNGSIALTAPTSARLSQEELDKPPFATHSNRRSSSDHNDGRYGAKPRPPSWYRRASVEASISGGSSAVGSDDTGWMTPKTSAGDADFRRRSVSPKFNVARRASIATPGHTDDTTLPRHIRRGSSARQNRPVSYVSSADTVGMPTSAGGGSRSASHRHTLGPQHSVSQNNLWFDDTPKASQRTRPEIPHVFRSSYAHPHRREASSYSEAGSAHSMISSGTVSFAEAKRSDKIDLFLRCTKAEASLQAITTQAQIEKEALLDALQESRDTIDGLRRHTEELEELLGQARRSSVRRQTDQTQETARRIAEIVEARDEWQRRAQAAERDLTRAEAAQHEQRARSEATISSLQSQLTELKQRLADARMPKAGSQVSSAARGQQASGLPRRVSPGTSPKAHSNLPRASTGQLRNSVSGLPRSRHSTGSPRHGRATSNNSSTFQTDFGDHLPASSDGWSVGDSQDASLRLDDSTAKYLQDIDGQSIRLRQKSATSSV